MRSAWYEAFRADMRSSVLVRAVEVGLGQVGYATSWTSNKLAAASQGFRYASAAMSFGFAVVWLLPWQTFQDVINPSRGSPRLKFCMQVHTRMHLNPWLQRMTPGPKVCD